MASRFSWLDASEHDRRRSLEVIDLFQQKETVDELGVGSVRDTIADFVAPGTSTIQRRARYFFFIPWIYQSLEGRHGANERMAARARSLEVALIEALAANEDKAGIIGIESRASLKRLPSEIYWQGLGRLGFRLFPGSQDQYHRVVERGGRGATRDETGDLALAGELAGNWHPRLPAAPARFPKEASFLLATAEAEFFRDQLRVHAPDSLLLFLVENRQEVSGDVYPWELPELPRMPAALQRWLRHGQVYSELMHGAALLYNLMLAQAMPAPDLETEYRHGILDWGANCRAARERHRRWDRKDFWTGVRLLNSRLPPAVQTFSEQWIDLVLSADDQRGLADDERARVLIRKREQELKGLRARLQSREHLQMWGGASSVLPLDYRWGITRMIVNDVVKGLRA